MRITRRAWLVLSGAAIPSVVQVARGEDEPPAINPFGGTRTEREDAVPGYLELSDGTVLVGNVYMTRDKRLKLEDRKADGDVRQREVPLRAVKQIECKVDKEWIEKEWRFKETTSDEKYYTGKSYPARVYSHTVTLKDGRAITGPLAEIVFVQPFASAEGPRAENPQPEAQRFMLHKRDKGQIGADLKSLRYVRLIKLGNEAVEEGKAKAEKKDKGEKVGGKKTPAKKTSEKAAPAEEEER
jgi:hypothetical protein